jgi:hypothetical protein
VAKWRGRTRILLNVIIILLAVFVALKLFGIGRATSILPDFNSKIDRRSPGGRSEQP